MDAHKYSIGTDLYANEPGETVCKRPTPGQSLVLVGPKVPNTRKAVTRGLGGIWNHSGLAEVGSCAQGLGGMTWK